MVEGVSNVHPHTLAKSKVGDLDVAVLVKHQILQLEVSVDDAFFMQVPVSHTHVS